MPDTSSSTKQLGLKFAVPFLSAFILLGAVMAGYGTSCWLEARNVRLRWQTTDGRILTSTSTRTGKSTKIDIHYNFTVDGQSYESDKVRIGNLLGDNSDAENLVHRYPAGHTCTVYYNPADPSRSVLDAATNPVMIYLIDFGLAFFCLAGMALLNLLRGFFALRQLGRAAQTIASTGAGDFNIGRTVISLRPGGFGLAQRPKLTAGALGGAGFFAFTGLFILVILFRPRPADTQMEIMLGLISAGLLAGLGWAAVWRSVTFDEKTGTLTFVVRRIFGQRRRSWPISQIKAPVLIIRGVRINPGQTQLLLKLRMTDGELVDLLSDGGADQTLLLAGTLLAQALARPLVIQSEVTVDNLETALEAVEALGLKGTLTVDHAPEEMPPSVRKVVDKVVGTAEALGVPPQALLHREPPQASVSGDHLAQGEPAAEALSSGSLSYNIGGYISSIVGTAAGLAFVGFGLYFLSTAAIAPLFEQVRASGWPTVPGHVTEVTRKNEPGQKGATKTQTYKPLVRFNYTVDGTRYEGNSPFLRPSYTTSGAADKVLASYHVGQDVKVHYDPANLARSVLELPFPRSQLTSFGFLIPFAIMGWWIITMATAFLRYKWQLRKFLSCGPQLNGRFGSFRFAEGPDWLDIVWRPALLMPALAVWGGITMFLGTVALLTLDPVPALAFACGVPLAAALALVWRGRQVRQQLSVGADGSSQIVQWSRQGWFGGSHAKEWAGKTVEVIFVDAEQRQAKNGVYYVPRLKLMLTGGRVESALDKACGDESAALSSVGLARGLNRPLWISSRLGPETQSVFRQVLKSQNYMNLARVIGGLQDTSWDERLGLVKRIP